MFTGSQGLLQLNVLVLGAGKAGTALGQGLRQALHLVPQEALTLLHLGQGSAQPLHRQLHVGNLISGSSAFSTSSLNIRKFTVHVLLKPSLENFEHYFTSM